ncbi:hypothetical protein QJQ45_022057 [Haematococcus lacustris]|nr:hypothetical protein QJQ45_022057 [Haematococcus lacustris]
MSSCKFVGELTMSGPSKGDNDTGRSGMAEFMSMTAHQRHTALINDYMQYYGGAQKMAAAGGLEAHARQQRAAQVQETDLAALTAAHRFIREPGDDATTAYGARLARRYYNRLFREYCIADLSRYKESKLGLRWRTQAEVVSGKGQFVCGVKGCSAQEGLASYEVNFAYTEAGSAKQALVKLRCCLECALKLNYKREKAFRKLQAKQLTLPSGPRKRVATAVSDDEHAAPRSAGWEEGEDKEWVAPPPVKDPAGGAGQKATAEAALQGVGSGVQQPSVLSADNSVWEAKPAQEAVASAEEELDAYLEAIMASHRKAAHISIKQAGDSCEQEGWAGGSWWAGAQVVSNRMQKTVVVAVSYVVWVPRYKVYEKRVGRHMAHDEQQQCVVGDLVKIVTANRKLSKHKSYHVAQILRKAGVSSSEPAPPAVPLQPDTVPSMLEVAQQRVAAAEARLAAAKQLYLERMRSAPQPAPSATSKPASDAIEALLPASPSQPAQAAMQQPRLGLGPSPSPSQPVPGSLPVRQFSSQAVSSRDRAHQPLALALAGGIGRCDEMTLPSRESCRTPRTRSLRGAGQLSSPVRRAQSGHFDDDSDELLLRQQLDAEIRKNAQLESELRLALAAAQRAEQAHQQEDPQDPQNLMQEVALTANKITAMYSGPSPFSALDFVELTAFTNVAGPGSCLVYNGSGHLALQPHGSGSMTVQSDEADSEDEEEVGSRQAAADMETTFGENEEEEEGSELGSEPVQLYAIAPKGRRAALVPASDFQQHVDSAKQELAATADAVVRDLHSRFLPPEHAKGLAVVYAHYGDKQPSGEDFLERLAIVKARYCMDATLADGQLAPALLDQQKLSAQQSAFVKVMRCQAEHRVQLSSSAANPAKETTKLWRYLAGQPITKADILEYIKLAELALVMTPGSVEEERMFSAMAYLKDDTRNRLQECPLNVVGVEGDVKRLLGERLQLLARLQRVEVVEDSIRELFVQMKGRVAEDGSPRPESLQAEKAALAGQDILVVLGALHAQLKGLWAFKVEAEAELQSSRGAQQQQAAQQVAALRQRLQQQEVQLRRLQQQVEAAEARAAAAEEAAGRVGQEAQAVAGAMAAQNTQLLAALKEVSAEAEAAQQAARAAQQEGRRRDGLVLSNRQLESARHFDRVAQDRELRRLQTEHEQQLAAMHRELHRVGALMAQNALQSEQLSKAGELIRQLQKSTLPSTLSALQHKVRAQEVQISALAAREQAAAKASQPPPSVHERRLQRPATAPPGDSGGGAGSIRARTAKLMKDIHTAHLQAANALASKRVMRAMRSSQARTICTAASHLVATVPPQEEVVRSIHEKERAQPIDGILADVSHMHRAAQKSLREVKGGLAALARGADRQPLATSAGQLEDARQPGSGARRAVGAAGTNLPPGALHSPASAVLAAASRGIAAVGAALDQTEGAARASDVRKSLAVPAWDPLPRAKALALTK